MKHVKTFVEVKDRVQFGIQDCMLETVLLVNGPFDSLPGTDLGEMDWVTTRLLFGKQKKVIQENFPDKKSDKKTSVTQVSKSNEIPHAVLTLQPQSTSYPLPPSFKNQLDPPLGHIYTANKTGEPLFISVGFCPHSRACGSDHSHEKAGTYMNHRTPQYHTYERFTYHYGRRGWKPEQTDPERPVGSSRIFSPPPPTTYLS